MELKVLPEIKKYVGNQSFEKARALLPELDKEYLALKAEYAEIIKQMMINRAAKRDIRAITEKIPKKTRPQKKLKNFEAKENNE